MKGKVYLIGAGPGDGGLLTLKGKRILQEADAVVYDRLVSNEVLEMIPENTERIYVGKNAGRHPVPQYEINDILVRLAEEGKVTARLKGGDPFVFGRGGEELEQLSDRGIDFEVIPGVTSSIAVPAYAGIPVTHRDYCSSLHIITGHARAGKEPEIDYEALVRLKGTLIFMMSVSSVSKIMAGLLGAGMDPDTPCAVIENGTRSFQRKFISTISEISGIAAENDVKSPSVILVGKVAELSDQFDWFGKLPLRNTSALVTQPSNKSSRMADGLRKAGADVMLYPCIRTAPIDGINPPIDDYNVLVFTSTEGVRYFFDWLMKQGDVRLLAGKRIACIGSATAGELLKHGVRADCVPKEYSAGALGREMAGDLQKGEKGFLHDGEKVLMLRAEEASQDINDIFDQNGIHYLDYPIYRTSLVQHDPVNLEDFDFVTFTSRSTVTGFVRSQETDDFSGFRALCIGRQTAQEAEKYGFDTVISDEATIESMIAKAVTLK